MLTDRIRRLKRRSSKILSQFKCIFAFFSVIGFVNRSESRSSVLLPEVYIENPLTNESKNKEIVYISRYAKDLLDGPLNQYAFILPVTFDNNRESIDGARKGGFRLMSLPFKKYVK
jgi:hypothetical protein